MKCTCSKKPKNLHKTLTDIRNRGKIHLSFFGTSYWLSLSDLKKISKDVYDYEQLNSTATEVIAFLNNTQPARITELAEYMKINYDFKSPNNLYL